MARPRKPLELRLLDGTYQPSRHGPVPVGDGAAPAPPVRPADLTGSAAEVWDRLARLLAGVVRDSDGPMLAELCRWWAELGRSRAALARSEPGAGGYGQLLVAAGICFDKVSRLAGLFGLTPSDRARLRFGQAGPVVARVATRPRTRLDREGGPPGGAGG